MEGDEPDTKDQKLEPEEEKVPEFADSNLKGDETASFDEDKAAAAVDDVAAVEEVKSDDVALEMRDEDEVKKVVDDDVTVGEMADTGDVPVSCESEMETRGDELRGVGAEEGFREVVESGVGEEVVTDTGFTEHLSEFEKPEGGVNEEVSSVSETIVALEDDVTKVEEMGGVENELVGNDDTETRNVEDGGKGNEEEEDKVDDVVANDLETGDSDKLVGGEDEKVDNLITEKVEIEQVETEVEMITEENVVVVSEKEQVLENAEDGDVVVNESLVGDTEMVESENTNVEVLEDAKIDEPVSVEESKEVIVKEEIAEGDSETDKQVEAELELMGSTVAEEAQSADEVIVKEEIPEMDCETEKQVEAELELTESNVAEEIQLADADMETETVKEVVDDKFVNEDVKIETEETSSGADEADKETCDSPDGLEDEEDEQMVAEDEMGTQDTEMETETDVAESEKKSGEKPKRGKLSKSPSISRAKSVSRKTVGEDVCFICFDGGELVLCDRRGCPKAYHPTCVNRDEAFFKSKGRWNCGWHLCSNCEKDARYMCYTCTFSLCKSCVKDAVISCVRGNKGFCETCMRTVLLIENNEQGDNDSRIDFDDRSSWEFLFKDYYTELKSKLSLSLGEITEAKNPWKGVDRSGPTKQESSEAQADAGSGSDDNSIEAIKPTRSKRRKVAKQAKSTKRKELVSTGVAAGSLPENSEWASKELLEFVAHMKDGDTSVVNQYDLQQLLLEYIKRNKLRDPRRKSQVICDARLQSLFGKPRCGHFEMLKLLESHYFIRDEQNDDVQGSVVDTENNQVDTDDIAETPTKGLKDKRKRKSRKRNEAQDNLDDYAAIDMHNISLIYLRRKLMEDLLEEADSFPDKVVGTFVRIRISGSTQKQDLYRLVQVAGTSKASEPYSVGKKTTDIMVEIQNLDKTEIIKIDTISNQEFTEEECKRLRQSIKCGLISRLTVGEILDKTTELQTARVTDWIEGETLRLTHLRDRASDMGLRKDLRESVEKLDRLKTPEERRRRLEEIPEIHADPKMDPSYESDEKESESEESRREAFMRSRGVSFVRRGKGPISPGTDKAVKDTWGGAAKAPTRNWDSSGNNFYSNSTHVGETVNENPGMSERDIEEREAEKIKSGIAERYRNRESLEHNDIPATPQASLSSRVSETSVKINESEKIWNYKDPSGKQQGPFSIVQLRKWNNTGYFPADLRIWKVTGKEENSILLADALAGKFPEESPVQSMFPVTNTLHSPHGETGTGLHQGRESSNANQNSGYISKLSTENWSGNEMTNLPSPTPSQRNAGIGAKVQSHVVSGVLSSPTAVLHNMGTLSSASPSVLNSAVHSGTSFSPMPNTQQGLLMGSADSLYTQSTMMGQQPHPVQQMQVQPPAVVQPVQPVLNQNAPSGQPQDYNWGTSNLQSSSAVIQPNIQPPVAPSASWGMGPAAADNSTSMGVRPENPNAGWGNMQANQNMGWGNMAPQNMNWGPSMQVPPTGNATLPGWAPPAGNVQGMVVPGNMNPGWAAPPVQGALPGNGWVPPSGNAAPIQGPPAQGNANQGWGPQQGNQVPWGGEQNHNGGPFPGQGGGGRPWNRQSSFGGGSQRKRDMVCPYNAKGRCRKGNRCDYMHI